MKHARAARGKRGRWLRRWWPDRNPVRRASDRAEAAVLAGLLAGFLVGAPLAGLAAGQAAYDSTLRASNAEQSSFHRIRAVLLAGAPRMPGDAYGLAAQSVARARWTTPDGKSRTGAVPAPAHARAGSTVTVWTDGSGRPVPAPIQRDQVTGQALLAAAFAASSLGLLVLCAGMAARHAFNRRRMADLEAEWRAAGPRWGSLRLAASVRACPAGVTPPVS